MVALFQSTRRLRKATSLHTPNKTDHRRTKSAEDTSSARLLSRRRIDRDRRSIPESAELGRTCERRLSKVAGRRKRSVGLVRQKLAAHHDVYSVAFGIFFAF
jgi:hypothetical protein